MKKLLLNPLSMLVCGLLLGVLSRLFDIYTEILGNVFSRLAVWILLGTLIAVYSPTKWKAVLNIFPFCIGMLAAYYAVAIMTHGVYGEQYIIGWTVFAFCSPIFAYITWMAKEKGKRPKLIACGILCVSVLSSFLFRGTPILDFILDGVLLYVLFFKKIERE